VLELDSVQDHHFDEGEQSMKKNRILNINVEFHVSDQGNGNFGGSAVYTHQASSPRMDTVVDRDGSIHLDRAVDFDSSEYNENVDIVFLLQSPCSGDEAFDVEWATKYGRGMSIVVPDGGKGDEMEISFDSSHPHVIVVEDKDDDNKTYNYKPAVELVRPGHDRYYISLDPQIVNRPRN